MKIYLFVEHDILKRALTQYLSVVLDCTMVEERIDCDYIIVDDLKIARQMAKQSPDKKVILMTLEDHKPEAGFEVVSPFELTELLKVITS